MVAGKGQEAFGEYFFMKEHLAPVLDFHGGGNVPGMAESAQRLQGVHAAVEVFLGHIAEQHLLQRLYGHVPAQHMAGEEKGEIGCLDALARAVKPGQLQQHGLQMGHVCVPARGMRRIQRTQGLVKGNQVVDVLQPFPQSICTAVLQRIPLRQAVHLEADDVPHPPGAPCHAGLAAPKDERMHQVKANHAHADGAV